MPVSIDLVAQRAGVSQSTVSQVLNGNVHARIAVRTQERVRRAAAELGYQPNHIARSLGRRRTDTLGLMISGLQNPFFVQVVESAEHLALEAGYHILVDAEPTPLGAVRHQGKLLSWPVDGVVMWATPTQTLAQFLGPRAVELPVVYLSGQPRPDESDAVYFDVYAGARAAMTFLLERGHRRIGFVYPYPWVAEQADEPRCRAYREACAGAGIPPQLLPMERREETRRAGLEAGLALAAMPASVRPGAVLCFNDVVAQGVLFGLRRAGLRVPSDVAIVGFDGLEEGQYLDVPLTSVRLPSDLLCREALQMLLRRITEGPSAPPQTVVVPTQLILGGTA